MIRQDDYDDAYNLYSTFREPLELLFVSVSFCVLFELESSKYTKTGFCARVEAFPFARRGGTIKLRKRLMKS